MASKLYPVGIQNFEKLRKDGYCYIDKTEKIYKLVKTELDKHLEQWEKLYGSDYSDRAPEERFYHIIRMAYDTLKPFYGVMKSMDGYIKFALLTGVTKFGKVSMFSDLNNLEDISRNPYYADICGISEEELLKNFSEDIQELASSNGQTFDQACERLRTDYDGYHFCPGGIGIYNPFSLLNTFKSRQYGSYWFETGTPTYLVELLKKHKYDLYTKVEYHTSQGRIDLVLQTPAKSTSSV